MEWETSEIDGSSVRISAVTSLRINHVGGDSEFPQKYPGRWILVADTLNGKAINLKSFASSEEAQAWGSELQRRWALAPRRSAQMEMNNV